MKVKLLDKLALLLLVIGGLNWGLVGLLQFNLVDGIFGVGSVVSRVIYAVVGVASVYGIYTLVKMFGSSDRQ